MVIILSILYDNVDDLFPGVLKHIENSIILKYKVDPPLKLQGGFIETKDRYG